MARRLFGGDLTGWTMALGDTVTASSGASGPQVLAQTSVSVTMWSAQSGGVQYTDLLDQTGVAQTFVTTDAATGQIPAFQGPDADPEVTYMWADAGAGRQLLVATDLGDVVAANTGAIATLQAAQAGTAAPTFVYYNTASSSYPDRPSTGAPVWWIGPVAPPIGGTGAVDGLDYHIGPQ